MPSRKNFKIPVIYSISFYGTPYIYIGQTNNFEQRQGQHLSLLSKAEQKNTFLQNVYNKYKENIYFEILKQCQKDKLGKEEKLIIKYYRENRDFACLNILDGGEQNPMDKPECREKIRQKMLGREYPQEWRRKLSIAKIGTQSGEKNPMYGKRGILSPFFGRRHTKTTKYKMRMSRLNKAMPQISKERLSAAKGGKRFSAYKNNISVGEWQLQSDCAKALNVDQGEISRCLHNKSLSAGGYVFNYV